MSSTPIFDELWIEFIERGKFNGRMIGPPEAKKVFGLPVVEEPEPNMDETIVMEAVKEEAPKTMAALEGLVTRIAEIRREEEAKQAAGEEKQHVFPIRDKNDPILLKISADRTFNFFDEKTRAA